LPDLARDLLMERSFKKEVQALRLGDGEIFRGEGILAVTKALLQSGVKASLCYVSIQVPTLPRTSTLLTVIACQRPPPRGGHATGIERIGDGPQRLGARALYLANDLRRSAQLTLAGRRADRFGNQQEDLDHSNSQ
jgi:hypothetical protein